MMLSDSYAFQDVYKFHRLIFVNSAAYAYTVKGDGASRSEKSAEAVVVFFF